MTQTIRSHALEAAQQTQECECLELPSVFPRASPLRASQGLQVGRGLLLHIAAGLLLNLAQSFHQCGVGVCGRVGPGVVTRRQDHAAGLLLCGLLQRHLCSIHRIALRQRLWGRSQRQFVIQISHHEGIWDKSSHSAVVQKLRHKRERHRSVGRESGQKAIALTDVG